MTEQDTKPAAASPQSDPNTPKRKAWREEKPMDSREHFDPVTGNIEPPTHAAKEQDIAEKAAVAGLGIKRSG